MNFTRVPSSITIFFGKMPPGVMMKVASGNSGVPSALVPAAQVTPREFEYIARSTTSSCAALRLDQHRELAALRHFELGSDVHVEAAVGRQP